MTRGSRSLMTDRDRNAARDVLNPTINRIDDGGSIYGGLSLATDRSEAGKYHVWRGCGRGVWIHSAPINAESGVDEAGIVFVSCDSRADESNAPNSFSLLPGTSRRIPFADKIVFWHPAQASRRAYIEVSAAVPLGEQIFTPKVEAKTGRAEIVRYGSPDDIDIIGDYDYGGFSPPRPQDFAFYGFQEERVKADMLRAIQAKHLNNGLPPLIHLADSVGRAAVFTKQGATYFYRLTGETAQLDLRTLLGNNQPGTTVYAKFRFTLIDVHSETERLHILSAEIANGFGIYECTPLVNPDTSDTAPAGFITIEASRFESPWLRCRYGAAQDNFRLRMEGNAQTTDRAPANINATVMIDADYMIAP